MAAGAFGADGDTDGCGDVLVSIWRSRGAAPRVRRVRARGRGLAVAGIVVATALVGQTGVVSNASWNDSEWTQASIRTTDCADPVGAFATRGEGRALSGSAFGIDLDTLAEASGTRVTNDGSVVHYNPAGANPAGPDAYANPLNIVALSAVNLDLGRGVLQLPLDNATGVLAQYGQARSSGQSVGASGYVTSDGGIATEPADGYPELASLKLSTLLAGINPSAASLLTNVTDVSLQAGAVAGRASIDGCELAWAGAQPDAEVLASALTREYAAADVATVVSSPTVGALVTGVTGVVTDLNATVAGLAGNNGLTSGLTSGITGLLGGLLGGFGLGNVAIDSLAATIDLTPVTALLDGAITDSDGVVRIDLAAGTISVDTAALVKSAYGDTDGVSLNGLAPNTDLLADPRIIAALTDALSTALSEWLVSVADALAAAIEGIRVSLKASLRVLLLADITITVDKVSLAGLDEPGAVTVGTRALGSDLGGLLDGIVGALTSGVGPLLEGLIRGLLPLPSALVDTLRPLTTAITSTVSNVYNVLYLSGVVSLVVNAQNDPLTGGAEPADWRSLPARQYDVAALRIGLLGAVGSSDVHLYLGRGSVGPGCSLHQAASGCQGY